MRSQAVFGTTLLVVILALPSCTAGNQQDPGFVLRDVDVTVSGERLLLSTADGETYEVAALEALASCPADDGGAWPCGEGSRQALAEAVAGEALECRVLEDGNPPAVECRAQTRNLNVWMLEVGRATLHPDWRGRFPEYDDAESAARAAGALPWSNSGGETPEVQPGDVPPAESSGEPPSAPLPGELRYRAPPGNRAAASAQGGVVPGRFLLQGTEGDIRTYELVRPATGDGVPLEYIAHEQNLSAVSPRAGLPPGPGWLPAVGSGELVAHAASGGRLGYAQAPAYDDRSPLAYVLDSPEAQGRRYAAIMLDGIAWTSQRGALQPARTPLRSRVDRRGATAAERRAIGDGLPEDRLRAGVWTLGAFRIVVAEDPYGCARYTWCRFAVLDDAGIVVSGTALEAPELVAPNAVATAGAGASREMTGLVWAAPEGGWRVWTP